MTASRFRHLFPDPPTLVLYHAECADGFGAAWALWKRYPASRFRPVKHGEPPPQDLAGERIVIVDFSYPRPTLERIAKDAASLLVLDHHITAQQALSDLPYACFDQTRSGAVLAWQWAHDAPVPWLLQYIQDKDLWQWALPHSREISAALASHPFEFALWDSFEQQELEREGRAILRYENELVTKLAAHAVLGAIMQLYALARSCAGRMTQVHDGDVRNIAVYHHFLALSALIAFAVIGFFPRLA